MFPFNRSRRVINLCVLLLGFVAVCAVASWKPFDEPGSNVLVHFSGHDMQVQAPSARTALQGQALPSYYVLHVSPAGTSEGDGSYERPLSLPAEAVRLAHRMDEAVHVMIYVWGGTYEFSRSGESSEDALLPVERELLITGADQVLALGEFLVIPPQSDEPTIFEIRGLERDALNTLLPADALFHVNGKGLLRLNGLTLRSKEGKGVGIGLSAEGSAYQRWGVTLLNGVTIEGFGAGIYARPDEHPRIHLGVNNMIRLNKCAGIAAGSGEVELGTQNSIMDNFPRQRAGQLAVAPSVDVMPQGCGILAYDGSIVLKSRNVVTHNNAGVFTQKGTILLDSGNDVSENAAAGVASMSGNVTVGSANSLMRNNGDGVHAGADVRVGHNNRIEYNTGHGVSAGGVVVVHGSNNSLSHNGRAGIVNAHRVTISGNFNFIRSNNRLKDGAWQDVSAKGGTLIETGHNNDIPIIKMGD